MKKNTIVDQRKSNEDLGLDRGAQTGRQRTINPDGSFNVERKTGRFLGGFHFHQWLITTSWRNYAIALICFYTIMNVLFATIYFAIGVEGLSGVKDGSALEQWMYCFYFSAQSFTTVGYGGIHPVGQLSNFVAVTEALTGLMTFAIATGTVYGRFSRPVSKIIYSPNVLIAPYKDYTGLMFMVANELNDALVEVEARVNLSWSEKDAQGVSVRRFQQVKLEIDKIAMFPTNWIINHPITEESALFGKSPEEIRALEFEVFILMKGFDDVFSQNIYSRRSYTSDQFVFNAKFKRPFYVDETGKTVIDLTKIGEYEKL